MHFYYLGNLKNCARNWGQRLIYTYIFLFLKAHFWRTRHMALSLSVSGLSLRHWWSIQPAHILCRALSPSWCFSFSLQQIIPRVFHSFSRLCHLAWQFRNSNIIKTFWDFYQNIKSHFSREWLHVNKFFLFQSWTSWAVDHILWKSNPKDPFLTG